MQPNLNQPKPSQTPRQRASACCFYTIALLWALAPQRSPAAAVESFLHAQGQSIVNEKGDPIRLRGLGLGNWLLPEGYMWNFGNQADRPRRIEKLIEDLLGPAEAKRFWQEYRANYIADADLERMAALGFNSVRPAINSRVLLAQANPPVYSEEGFALLDHLIAQSKARGIYVILDMHAAPGGQTGQNIDDSEEDEPELFMDAACQDQLVALWTTIARRYKDEPLPWPATTCSTSPCRPAPARPGPSKPTWSRSTSASRRPSAAWIPGT